MKKQLKEDLNKDQEEAEKNKLRMRLMDMENRINTLEGVTEFLKQEKEELNNINGGANPG